MNKKEYIEKLKELIINKVKYHSPNLNNDNIDYSLLEAVGINVSLPIFIFNKELDNIYYKAFLQAKKVIDFNLILFKKPKVSLKKYKKLKDTYQFNEDEIGSNLFYNLDALNINYIAHSDYKNNLEGEYLKINNKKVELDYYPYYNYKKIMIDGVIIEIKCFLLNGKNYSVNFINTKREVKKINFEINIPLPRGYYFFKKNRDCVSIENLTTLEKAYFNYYFKDAKMYFSNMNGIDCCTFSCIHMNAEIQLFPQQTQRYYCNYGDKKYCVFSPKDIDYFFDLSQQKMNEIFDIKVISHNKNNDAFFNLYLPRKIWEKWQNFDIDEESENEWLKLRKKIVIKSDVGEQINKEIKGLKEVKFFRDFGWKRVFIVHNNYCYLYADNVKYFNYTLLTNEIFKQNNEIYLSFAD